MDDLVAGVSVRRGDRVELVRKAVGRYSGRVVRVDAQTLTIRMDYSDGLQRDIEIPTASIRELSNLGPPEGSPEMALLPMGPSAAVSRAYIDKHLGTFTPEALSAALVAAGHDPALVASILEEATARRAMAPVRSRAWRAIIAAYGLTYLVLAAVFWLRPADPNVYSLAAGLAKTFGPIVLAPQLLIALGLAWLWTGWRRLGLGFLVRLSVPLVLLAAIGGACYAVGASAAGWIP